MGGASYSGPHFFLEERPRLLFLRLLIQLGKGKKQEVNRFVRYLCEFDILHPSRLSKQNKKSKQLMNSRRFILRTKGIEMFRNPAIYQIVESERRTPEIKKSSNKKRIFWVFLFSKEIVTVPAEKFAVCHTTPYFVYIFSKHNNRQNRKRPF